MTNNLICEVIDYQGDLGLYYQRRLDGVVHCSQVEYPNI